MTTPIPEAAVEAAAKAMRLRTTWPSMHWPDINGVNHADTSRALAEAALTAARPLMEAEASYVLPVEMSLSVAEAGWDEGWEAHREFIDGPDWATPPDNPYAATIAERTNDEPV